LKFHGINCRFNGRKYPFTGSANASPVMPLHVQIQYSYLLSGKLDVKSVEVTSFLKY